MTHAARRSSTRTRPTRSASEAGSVVSTRTMSVGPTRSVQWGIVLLSSLVYRLWRVASREAQSLRPRAVPGGGSRTRRIVHALLLFVAFVIVVDAVVGERGMLAMRRARIEYQRIEAQLVARRADNAALRERVRRLHDDPTAIEEVARRELRFIRPGERVFIIRDRQ